MPLGMVKVDSDLSNAELSISAKLDMENPVIFTQGLISVVVNVITMNGNVVDGDCGSFC